MENSSAASASSEAGSSRSQEIEELERFIDSYVLEYQVQGLLEDKPEGDVESQRMQSHISQVSAGPGGEGGRGLGPGRGWAFGKVKEGDKGTLSPDRVCLPGPRLLWYGRSHPQSVGSKQEASLSPCDSFLLHPTS